MDSKADAVLAEYEARAAEEADFMHGRWPAGKPRLEPNDMLLPIGRDTALLLTSLIRAHGCRSILEVGTSFGYSTLWFADAAKDTGGKVISLELAPGKVDFARRMIERAGLSDYVDFVVGDAVRSIHELAGPFDFVLIDLWKDLYIPVLEAAYPKLADGALIASDNMLFPPMSIPDARAYQKAVRSKPGMRSLPLDIGAGIELSRFAKPS